MGSVGTFWLMNTLHPILLLTEIPFLASHRDHGGGNSTALSSGHQHSVGMRVGTCTVGNDTPPGCS